MTDILNLPILDLPADGDFRIDGDPGTLELDQLSFERFIESANNGVVIFLEDPTPLMLEHGDELAALFRLHVTKPPMSRYILDHRAFAIAGSVKELISRNTAPVPIVPSVDRAIGNIETWLATQREIFPSGSLTKAQVNLLFEATFCLSPLQVQVLTGVSQQVLGNWRKANTGPSFFRGSGRASILYPAAAIVSWLEGQ